MSEAGASFDASAYIGSVKGYYTRRTARCCRLPFQLLHAGTLGQQGCAQSRRGDPEADLTTWSKVGAVLDKLKNFRQ